MNDPRERCAQELAKIKGDDLWARKMRAKIREYWQQPAEDKSKKLAD